MASARDAGLEHFVERAARCGLEISTLSTEQHAKGGMRDISLLSVRALRAL